MILRSCGNDKTIHRSSLIFAVFRNKEWASEARVVVRYISASALVADPAYLESITGHVLVTIRGCGPIAARLRRISSGHLVAAFRHAIDLEPVLHP